MHLDLWHVADPQWLVVVEIGLIHYAVGQRDLVTQRRAQRVTDASLHLGDDNIRVNCDAAIDRANYPVHFEPPVSVVHGSEV